MSKRPIGSIGGLGESVKGTLLSSLYRNESSSDDDDYFPVENFLSRSKPMCAATQDHSKSADDASLLGDLYDNGSSESSGEGGCRVMGVRLGSSHHHGNDAATEGQMHQEQRCGAPHGGQFARLQPPAGSKRGTYVTELCLWTVLNL